ncbi:MAG: MBL fold metallo-hydrolase [Kiritimatiellae bacterium]|jgi:ribonuclease BN (tRNA processing enzyme)|nr:MBL fold metallo-hydrolase [Kiritimatiellia bacterium]
MMENANMRIVLGGVRGSACVSHPDYNRYGGATTSVLIDDGLGTRIVFDAGTGLQTLAPFISDANAACPVLMLFTHYHLDHLIGLPSFAPIYNPDWHIIFAAPTREGITPEIALQRLITAPFWPSPMRAHQQFLSLPSPCSDTPYCHRGFDLRWCALHHRNGCHAYRLDHRNTGASMVFATDFEWAASDESERAALFKLCREPRPADILIMEGHAPSAHFPDWGHSTWMEAVEVAQAVGAHQLVITHHGPADTDNDLSQRDRELKILLPSARLGYQGMELEWRRQDAK